jgi:7-cyano-7-deazaguanine reductase
MNWLAAADPWIYRHPMTEKADHGHYNGLTHLRQGERHHPSAPAASILEGFKNTHPDRAYWITLDCPEFTALCPITGQPDFGHLTIRYVPDKLCVESKSLKLYLFSFRNHGAFHEAVVNRIMDDIVHIIAPRQIVVKGEFNRRGGIAITVEVCYPS